MMEFGYTPIETLEKHHAIAKEQGLKYAYLGNVQGHTLLSKEESTATNRWE
jgi:pyruvate formate lyase activating enzyme